MAKRRSAGAVAAVLGLAVLGGAGGLWWAYGRPQRPTPTPVGWTVHLSTLAGVKAGFSDPFGVAVAPDGSVYVVDGGDTDRIAKVGGDGAATVLAGGREGFADGTGGAAAFNTPSGVAVDTAGNLYVADTGNNAVRKVTPAGVVTTLAGGGAAGDADGVGRAARFNGPVGVAVDKAGVVYVADTYNDRIRKITPDGRVSTLAGGKAPGWRDGVGTEALFDTPCAVAIDAKGDVLVADTVNDAIRRIDAQGRVTTVVHNTSDDRAAAPQGPVALATTADGYLYVAEHGRGRVLQLSPDGTLRILAMAPGGPKRIARPTGLALDRDGDLLVSDVGRRAVLRAGPRAGRGVLEADAGLGKPSVVKASFFPWPVGPQNGWHEVVGDMGEVRGAYHGDSRDHIHAGLDVRADVGATVLAVADEKVESPLATWDFDGLSEGLRVGDMTYIHMRVGRTPEGRPLDPERFQLVRDETGKPVAMRVKRGTRFHVGEPLGTVNRMAHVHLELGPPQGLRNPMVLPFPGFTDHTPPHVDAIRLFDAAGRRLDARRAGRVLVDRRAGALSIVVDAWDQIDGNLPRRRLGLYRLGYQLLRADGTPVKGFEQPRVTVQFDRMPADRDAVKVAYAESSGDTVHGADATRFLYVVTNTVRDGRAEPGSWSPAELAPGDYVLRILAADYAGNLATSGRDLPITVE